MCEKPIQGDQGVFTLLTARGVFAHVSHWGVIYPNSYSRNGSRGVFEFFTDYAREGAVFPFRWWRPPEFDSRGAGEAVGSPLAKLSGQRCPGGAWRALRAAVEAPEGAEATVATYSASRGLRKGLEGVCGDRWASVAPKGTQSRLWGLRRRLRPLQAQRVG